MYEYFILIAGFIVAIIVIGIFIYFMRKKNTLLDVEKNQNPIYSDRKCGGRFNTVNFTIPFVRISIYNDFIVISYSEKILLEFNEIQKIDIKQGLFSMGIVIHHTRKDIPSIIIWTTEPERIKQIIENQMND